MEIGEFKMGGIAEEQPQEVVPNPSETPPVDQAPEETPPVVEPETETPPVSEETPPPVEKPAPEPVAAVEPPTPVVQPSEPEIQLDDELKRIYEFKKQTGRGLDDFLALNKNWDEVSDIDILKDQIKGENKELNLNDEQVNLLLNKRLGIDTSEDLEELEEADKLMIKIEANKQRNAQKALQQKFNTPIEAPTPDKGQGQAVSDQITLANGEVMSKTEYERVRGMYVNAATDAVVKLQKETFSFETGSGDNKETVSTDFIVEKEDREEALNYLMNLPPQVAQAYSDDKGNLDMEGLTKHALFANPKTSRKAIGFIQAQAYAAGVESVLKQETNVNFETKRPDDKAGDSKPIMPYRDDVVIAKLQGF